MPTRSYRNFDISIERAGEGYRARVCDAHGGDASVDFSAPLTQRDLERFIHRLGSPRCSTRRAESEALRTAKQTGQKLFDAIFQPDIYIYFQGLLTKALKQNNGLRLRLRIAANAAELQDLPWEYLYEATNNHFLSISTETPLTRYLDITTPIFPRPITLPLRVLVMVTSPTDLGHLDVEDEWQRMQRAFDTLVKQGQVALERLEQSTRNALRRRLQRQDIHVLHYIGHGRFDCETHDGLLALEDANGWVDFINGQDLGVMLHDHRSLRLAVLNACEGGRTDPGDPYAGVAHSLVQQGLPAVIAMQFEISDRAARVFAEEFYTALIGTGSVDSALAEARKAIYLSGNHIEWGTPVLFSQTEGRIFDATFAKGKSESITAPQVLQPNINRLYEDGLSAFYLENWEKAEQCFQQVLQVQPEHSAVAQKLAQAQRELDLAQRYAQAQQHLEAQEWAAASQVLGKLATDAPKYHDVNKQLQEARKQAHLAELYTDARRLSQAAQPEAVISIFEQIRELDPDPSDPDGLLPAAKDALTETQRQKRLQDLYSQALNTIEEGNWQNAQRLLEQIQNSTPDYRDTKMLLTQARDQVHLLKLHQDAIRFNQAGQWQAVIDTFDQIARIQPDYGDPQDLLADAQQQKKLDELYQQVSEARHAKHWLDTEKLLAQILRLQPDYRDAALLMEKIKVEEARQHNTQPSAPRKLSRKFWLVSGVITLLVLFGLAGSWLFNGQISLPWLRESSVPVSVQRTITAPAHAPLPASILMASIPAGAFEMGSENDEAPVHTINLDAFYIDIYEVTNAEYAKCVEANVCAPPEKTSSYIRNSYYDNSQYANYPVIQVSWNDADTYCQWRGARLPTEAEWEKAARGGMKGKLYPWGDAFESGQANFCDSNCTLELSNTEINDGYSETSPVGSYAPNNYGLYDMSGNVWEWVADWYDESYYKWSPVKNPTGPEHGEYRVLRGGSWGGYTRLLRVSYRYKLEPLTKNFSNGFRCAAAIEDT